MLICRIACNQRRTRKCVRSLDGCTKVGPEDVQSGQDLLSVGIAIILTGSLIEDGQKVKAGGKKCPGES